MRLCNLNRKCWYIKELELADWRPCQKTLTKLIVHEQFAVAVLLGRGSTLTDDEILNYMRVEVGYLLMLQIGKLLQSLLLTRIPNVYPDG